MDWNLVLRYLFNGISAEFYLAFYIFAILGMTFSMLVHFQQVKKSNKRKQKETVFSFKYWFRNNIARLFGNLIAVFVFMRFHESMNIGVELTMFLGFIIGMSIDRVVLMIKNLRISSNEIQTT
jgi:hypothetical protein